MKDKFIETLEKGLKEQKLDISRKQKDNLLQYFQLLCEWKEKINLTAIHEPEEIAIKHFLDSIIAAQYFNYIKDKQEANLLDLGTGAGFPGIVLKIWQPRIHLTLADSVQKKVNFLRLVIEKLQLKDTETLHMRAEDLGKNPLYREQFDVVTARAVAPMSVLSEYCLPLLKKEGRFYALKGPNYQGELDASLSGIALLGGEIEHIYQYELPIGRDERTLIIIKKTRKTPKGYPRKSGVPSKKPL